MTTTAIVEPMLLVLLALVVYTFAGYPILIWLMARIWHSPVGRGHFLPDVALVIVAFNEEERIGRKLDNCLSQSYPVKCLRIVVASDGSTDSTADIVRDYSDRGVTLLSFPQRRGKAACLNDAVSACLEEILVLTDARQRLDPDAVRSLVANFMDPTVGAASGELVFETGDALPYAEGMDAYWRYEKFIRRQESRFRSVIGVTGALYAMRRHDFEAIPRETILDDVLIPMNMAMRGRRVVFDEQALAFDRPSREVSQEKSRKIRTLAGNFQLLAMHPLLLNPVRNPVWFQLVSHKVLRLIAPYALAAVFVCSALLCRTSFAHAALFGIQVAAYGLPLIGRLCLGIGGLRVTRLAGAFVALNWFAVLGLVHYLRSQDAHLWSSDRPGK